MDTPAVTFSRIQTILNRTCFDVSKHNALNLTNEAVMAEDILGDILGQVLGISLTNVNRSKSNVPAIDLTDDSGELVVQVTTKASGFSQKKEATINKFKNGEGEPVVKKVILLFFSTEKVSPNLLKKESIREGCEYEGYDLVKLNRSIQHCSHMVLQKILKILEAEFGDYEEINLIERHHYPQVASYLPRPLFPLSSDLLADNHSLTLTEFFRSHPANGPVRILIKGQSAMGKSIELENLASYFSDTELGMLPVLIPLINFKSKLEDYITAFQKQWRRIHPKKVILLFDGIDDISGALLKDFITDFNLFVQSNPNLNIIATIRSNVYTSEIGHGVSEGFKLKECQLTELSRFDVDSYLDKKMANNLRSSFEDYISHKLRAADVLLNPFYLSHLVEIFQQDTVPNPENKAEMIKRFVELKYQKDKRKYHSKANIPALNRMAEKIAVYLTLRGRNSINPSELSRFTELTMDDIRRCSLFKVKEQAFETFISFEHNNFQEYLCAEKLLGLPWEQLKLLIFHSPQTAVLKPKMINTVNFMFTLLPVESDNFGLLLELMIAHNQEMLMQFEEQKIYPNRRLELFKRYVEKGMGEKIQWLNGNIKAQDLAAFTGYSSKALGYTLQLIKSEQDSIQLYTLTLLLCAFPPDKVKRELLLNIQSTVCGLLSRTDFDEGVYENLIFILTYFRCYEDSVLEVIKNSAYHDTRNIRRSILRYIDGGKFPGQFNYILYSDDILNKPAGTQINVRHLYLLPLSEQLSTDNAMLLVEHFTAHVQSITRIVDAVGMGTLTTMEVIYRKIAEIYNADPNDGLYNAFLGLTNAIIARGRVHKGWGNPENFFSITGTSDRAFFDLLKKGISAIHMGWLPKIFNKTMTAKLILAYQQGQLDLRTMIQFRNGLELNKHPDYAYFRSQLSVAFPDDFKVGNDEYAILYNNRQITNLSLLTDRNLFLKEAEKIYSIFEQERTNEPELTFDLLMYRGNYEVNSRITSTIIFDVASAENLGDDFKCFEDWFHRVEWGKFVAVTVYAHLRQGGISLPSGLLESCLDYINTQIIPKINIREAMLSNNYFYHPMDSEVFMLVYFYRSGLIRLPTFMLLDLLYVSDGHFHDINQDGEKGNPELYELIKADVTEQAFKNRVIMNLEDSDLASSVLVEQALISAKYGYKEAIPLLVILLEGKDFVVEFKDEVFEALVKLTDEPRVFIAILDDLHKITASWHWKLCELLAKEPSQRPAIVELIELSLQQEHDDNDQYWLSQLLLLGVELGSRTLAAKMLDSLLNRKVLPGHYQFPDLDTKFLMIALKYPQWLIECCFKVLPSTIGARNNSSYDLCAEFLEKVIRYTSVQHYDSVEHSLLKYDEIINTYAPSDTNFNYIQWYKKRLLKEYYATSKGYESEEKTWEIVNEIFS